MNKPKERAASLEESAQGQAWHCLAPKGRMAGGFGGHGLMGWWAGGLVMELLPTGLRAKRGFCSGRALKELKPWPWFFNPLRVRGSGPPVDLRFFIWSIPKR